MIILSVGYLEKHFEKKHMTDNNVVKKKVVTYPIIGIFPKTGNIVLFSSLTTGTFLKCSESCTLKVGTTISNFARNWIPYPGMLNMSNDILSR